VALKVSQVSVVVQREVTKRLVPVVLRGTDDSIWRVRESNQVNSIFFAEYHLREHRKHLVEPQQQRTLNNDKEIPIIMSFCYNNNFQISF
jgi:hypothetical protein